MDPLKELSSKLERCFLQLTGTYELQPKPTKDEDLRRLGETYGLKIITDDEIDCLDLSYDAPTRGAIRKAGSVLEGELNIYTPEIIRRSRLEQIILCKQLRAAHITSNPKPIGGMVIAGIQYVDTMFLNTGSLDTDEAYGRRLFHHELFHAIDHRDTWLGVIDTEWPKLQGKDFRYGVQQLHDLALMDLGRRIVDRRAEYDIVGIEPRPSKDPGFVSDYAKLSVPEDKAELFAALIIDYDGTIKRTKRDAPLKRKVAFMKKLLHRFCSDFDEEFWRSRSKTGKQ